MELRKYDFDFNILDNFGKDQHMRLANNDDVSRALDKGEAGKLTSPSEHIWDLVDAEQEKFPMLDQKTALERVQKKHAALFRLYAAETNGKIHVVKVA